MTRRIQEGDFLDVALSVYSNSIGTNGLRDASCLSCCHLGLAYCVQQRCLQANFSMVKAAYRLRHQLVQIMGL